MNIVHNYKYQKGVSLVGAIFIMVALAAIGIAMVTLNSTTTTTSALNIEQKRAYYAAKSGMEWAVYKVLENDSNTPKIGSCENSVTSTFDIEGFSVNISCDSTCDISSPSSCCMGGSCLLNPRITTLGVTASKGSAGEIYNVSRTIQSTISYDGI